MSSELKNAIRTNFDQGVDVLGGHSRVQYPCNGNCIYNKAISGIFLLTTLTANMANLSFNFFLALALMIEKKTLLV